MGVPEITVAIPPTAPILGPVGGTLGTISVATGAAGGAWDAYWYGSSLSMTSVGVGVVGEYMQTNLTQMGEGLDELIVLF